MENRLEAFLEVIPELKEILQDDIAVAVADTKKFIYYRDGDSINLPIKVGQGLNPEEPLYKSIKEGKVLSVIVPKELLEYHLRGFLTLLRIQVEILLVELQ